MTKSPWKTLKAFPTPFEAEIAKSMLEAGRLVVIGGFAGIVVNYIVLISYALS